MLANRILLFSLVLLSFIPTFAQSSAPAAGRSTVVVYRPRRLVASGLTPSVYVDERETLRLDNGRFASFTVPAGKHIVRSNAKRDQIEINAAPGETIYLELRMVSGTWKAEGHVYPVGEEEAKKQLKRLKPLDDKWFGTGDAGGAGGAGGSSGASGTGSNTSGGSSTR